MHVLNLAYNFSARFAFFLFALAIGGTVITVSDAGAHLYCVDNAVDLQNALDRAPMDFPNEYNFVAVVEGTYHTSAIGAPFHYASTGTYDMYIVGGQVAGCHSRALNPTILDGSNLGNRVLEVHNTNGGTIIESLTIQNGSLLNDSGAGLSVNQGAGEKGYVQVSQCIIRNNETTGSFAGFILSSGNHQGIYFTDNLVIGNKSSFGATAGGLYGDQTAEVDVLNNTVFNNTTTNASGFGGIQYSAQGPGFFTNNIIWNNTDVGISLKSPNVILNDNDYGSIGGTYPPQAGSSGNLSVNPHFVDAANENFHLGAASTLMGIGVPRASAAADLDGHIFATKGHIDLGAYQNTIFSTDFDSAN